MRAAFALRPGQIELVPLGARGRFALLDEDTGIVHLAAPHGPRTLQRTTNVAALAESHFRGSLDAWIAGPFRAWEHRFARAHPARFNALINAAPIYAAP